MSGSQSTESDILSTIPDFQDDAGDIGGDTGGQDTGGNTRTSAQPGQQVGGQGRTSSAPVPQSGNSRDPNAAPHQQQPGQFRTRRDGLLEYANPDNPAVRDLVDPVTGRVVAHGGIERRVYEEGQRHARENQQLKTQLQQVSGALRGINQVTQEAARLNVAPEDQVIAIKVMADFMRDPVRTLQYLVEEVKSKGYQIPFLTQGVSPGMDMSAIARMIDTKMQPFTQRSQQEQQQQQVAAQSKQELDTFLSDNEEANANLDVLAEMLQAQPSLTLHSAYTRMIRWAHENGLDWTQPLKQQIAAARAGQQPTHQQTTQQPTRAIPGRGGASGNGARPIQNNGNDVAQFNENASWADIIRSAMRESNVQLN